MQFERDTAGEAYSFAGSTPFAPAKLCAHGAVFFERVIETANLRRALPVVLLAFPQRLLVFPSKGIQEGYRKKNATPIIGMANYL